jgi:hypothetical protein
MNDDWARSPELPKLAAPFIAALQGKPDFPRRLAEMLMTLSDRMAKADVTTLAAWARTLAPGDGFVWQATSRYIEVQIPSWHWAIARDVRRNDAYDRAIRNCITANSVVLEIGTGTGILAMMAARAGAHHVYTLEIVPAIAAAARANIAANGHADRITVITADAMDVRAGDQLPQRCNVFLHEIISNDLLAEDVLKLSAHARAELLTADAMHLPDEIWAMGQLANFEPKAKHLPIGEQAGFDLSAIDILMPFKSATNGPLKDLYALSEPHELIRFNLTGAKPLPPRDSTLDLTITADGQANHIIQWIGFSFPDGTIFDNPPSIASSWAIRNWRIPELTLKAGETVPVRVRYTDQSLIPSIM